MKFTLREYQAQAVQSVFKNIIKGNRLLCLIMGTGTGKALWNGEYVATPKGFKRISDITEGEIISTPDGKTERVSGVFPQGSRLTYKVRFSDGSCSICDGEHIWNVHTRKQKFRGKLDTLKTVNELKGDLKLKDGRNKWYIPITEPVFMEDKNVVISPYVMGALLGDGSFRHPQTLLFSNGDKEICNKVIEECSRNNCSMKLKKNSTYEYTIHGERYKHKSNVYKEELKRYNLWGEYSSGKFIPLDYLNNSVENRLELLRGLMDTDGTVDKRGITSFSSSSYELVQGVLMIVNSLGGIGSFSERETKYTYKDNLLKGKDSYTLHFKIKENPFSLKRKSDRYTVGKIGTRAIVSIEEFGMEECTCIKVDNDEGLFLTNNYLVTHNTFTFSHVAEKVIEKNKKVLVLAHRSELLTQAKGALEKIIPKAKVCLEQGTLVTDDDADIIIASVQTLGRAGSDRINKFDPKDFGLIIVDEAHHITASTYQNILTYFGANKETGLTKGHPVVLGVTATPNRADNVGLEKILDVIAYSYDMQRAINDGYLTPIRAFTVFTDTDLDGVKTSMGDFNIGELSDTVNTPERNLQIIETYVSKCPGELAIVFAVDVQHAKDLSETFNNQGINSNYITGALKKDVRKQILDDFHKGDIRVLINVGVLTEGFDEPNIRAVFLARPTKSSSLYIQMVGRGTRLAEGKEYCKIFDFVDNMKNNRIMSSSSLIGIGQPIAADDTDIYEMQDKLEELMANKPQTNLRELDLDKIDEKIAEVDIFAAAELDDFVKDNSQYSWTTFLGGFKISLGENDDKERLFIEIREDAIGKFKAFLIKLKPQVPTFENKYKNFKKITTDGFVADDRLSALKLGDKIITDNYRDQVNLVSQNAKWKKESPTEKQVSVLKKNGFDNAESLSKGQATQLISKIFADKYNK